MERNQKAFREELETLVNRYSMENGSNTPDFILAVYMAECLIAFDKACNRREEWHGRTPHLIGGDPAPPSAPTPITE